MLGVFPRCIAMMRLAETASARLSLAAMTRREFSFRLIRVWATEKLTNKLIFIGVNRMPIKMNDR